LSLEYVLQITESCMRRAGLAEIRSYPPLQTLLKPTTKDTGSPPVWRLPHVIG